MDDRTLARHSRPAAAVRSGRSTWSRPVVDVKGRTVPDLSVDDFIVEEDGQPQMITHLLPSAALPISIGVVIDVSGSMQSKIRTAQRAVDRFLSMIHENKEYLDK